MDHPPKTGQTIPANPSSSTSTPESAATDEDEFARLRRRSRHPLLAVGAAVLALFLIVKMRFDLGFFLSAGGGAVEDLGEARALASSERGRHVLEEGRNRLVRIHGTPDRESALQIDTQGSWTFTQFFRLLGTDSRVFVHRREDPLPAFRAEQDVFEGRLMRFGDLSFEDAIRAYFASHVSATHFFRPEDIRAVVAAGLTPTVSIRDLGGDQVTLGPNDILAIDIRHPEAVEVALPTKRFHDPQAARAALAGRGAIVIAPGRPMAEHQVWRVAVTPGDRDRVLNAIAAIDFQADIREVRETIKVRLMDLEIRPGTRHDAGIAPGEPPSLVARQGPSDSAGGHPDPAPRALSGIDSIRTLATVQIPTDAFLIVEGETPREHLPEAAIALVLVVFASVNLIGMVKGLRA